MKHDASATLAMDFAMSSADDAVGNGAAHDDVPALRKGLALLDLLAARGPLSMAELQRASGLNRTMTYRLLRALGETGYVCHDAATRRYALGLRLLQLGAAVTARLEIATVARPLLAELREETQETVNCGLLDGNEIVYVAMLESPLGLRMAARLGGRDPAHSTSLGKAMLAFLPAEERERIVTSLLPLRALTPATIADPATLARDLSLTRERGYALDDQENESGARCVGVPVLDSAGRPLAGLSVSGPAARIDPERAAWLAARLWRASRELSRRLGLSVPIEHAEETVPPLVTGGG
ncbi:MAG: IclR family transcriptional regulator [Thermomicrobiales bacterium]